MKDIIKKILREETFLIQEMPKKVTTQDFIERSKKVHGDKYDYSKSVYTGRFQPITLICPIHGEYTQRADAHMLGQECPICGDEKQAAGRRLTTDEFIEKAKEVHGDKYDYSETQYFSRKQNGGKVKIICPIHGPFEQIADNHLKGSGCNKCAGRLVTNQEEFIQKAKEIFGDKYDYSKSDYRGSNTPVGVICKKHGLFTVTPSNHISKLSGCPICKESKGENLLSTILSTFNLKYIRQKTFTDCVGISGKKYCRKLPFDFFIPKYNAVIEYDGRQHFEPVMEFGGEENFKKTQSSDQIKNQYCQDKGIKMIRIPYTMDKDDIPNFIKGKLGIK